MGNCVDKQKSKVSVSQISQNVRKPSPKRSNIKIITSEPIPSPPKKQTYTQISRMESESTSDVPYIKKNQPPLPQIQEEPSIADMKNTFRTQPKQPTESNDQEQVKALVNTTTSIQNRKQLDKKTLLDLYHVLVSSVQKRKEIVYLIQECVSQSKELIRVIQLKLAAAAPGPQSLQMKKICMELKSYVQKQNIKAKQMTQKNGETLSWTTDIQQGNQDMGYQDSKRCIDTVKIWIQQINSWREPYQYDMEQIKKYMKEYGAGYRKID